MSNTNYTVFQRLTKMFGYPGRIKPEETPKFNFSKDELLKTDNKEDYEKSLLQAQQSQYIADKWTKLDQSLYNQSVYYEPNRLAAYYDYESMEFCLHGDTKIAIPDGFITIKELADKGKDFEFITYAYDHNLKKVVPAKARNAHYTRDEMTYKVTFDDDTFIIATWEHRLMKRDGTFSKVSELKKGDSMMPFYRKSFLNNENYNWVYTCNLKNGHNGWISEEKIISDFYKTNKYNQRLINVTSEHLTNKLNGYLDKNENNKIKIPFDNIINVAKIQKTLSRTSKELGVTQSILMKHIVSAGYKDWKTFCIAYNIIKSKLSTGIIKNNSILNHKIKSITEYGIVPVYDLTVPGYKNFATDTIFSHNTPEISAALDIYAEESTTPSEKGQILTIFSESNRVKNILEDLFINVLDVNTNLQMWTRNLCKYGDNFLYLKIDPEKGIIGCQQLPNIEIERIEGVSKANAGNSVDPRVPTRELRFQWKSKDIEFQAWEMAHFRLLGDDRKLPYGTSMLDKIRRIWKQLLLAEDAMLIYRTSRAPERRVFKVFVGNMDDKDIEAYVQRVASKFKRDMVTDPRNGQVDMRYNQMSVDQDFFIPVRDPGQSSPIETLAGASNLGEIADIEYIQKKMLAALRIPKAFLGFEEIVGDGKNLALMDIRFARTINRIQKSVIQELNKIALVHLYLLGLEDELQNFSLGLTNPSAQSDLLKIEQWKEKITLYKDATSDQSQLGILPVSHTWAKKNILGFSDNDVLLDLQQQRIERAMGFELMNTQNIIRRSGIFDNIDSKYGIPEEERQKMETAAAAAATGEQAGGAGGGLGSLGGMMGGGSSPLGGGGGGGEPPLSESKNKEKIILDSNSNKIEDLFDFEKAQNNINEIENKLKQILND